MADDNKGCPLCDDPKAPREWAPNRRDAYTVWCEGCNPFTVFAPLPKRVWAKCSAEKWGRLRAGLITAVKKHWERHTTPLKIDGENWRPLAEEGLLFSRRNSLMLREGEARKARGAA
jgi:hypothetical protein